MGRATTRCTSRSGRDAVLAMLVALVTVGCDSHAQPQRKGKRSMTYDDAVALLQKPERWCEGAAALAKLGDSRAIKPLFGVVALPGEELPDRACVREALEKLGARQEAARLITSVQLADRRTAVGLMKELPADAHIPALARAAAGDSDA